MTIGQKLVKSFDAHLDHLYSMLRFITIYAENMGFEGVDLSRIELACEEALVNIIEYAYTDNENGVIEISLHGFGNQEIQIKILDRGKPFNPLSNSKKFEIKSFKTNPTIGGYGTYFIIELMDQVEYERGENTNILTLIKRLPDKS